MGTDDPFQMMKQLTETFKPPTQSVSNYSAANYSWRPGGTTSAIASGPMGTYDQYTKNSDLAGCGDFGSSFKQGKDGTGPHSPLTKV